MVGAVERRTDGVLISQSMGAKTIQLEYRLQDDQSRIVSTPSTQSELWSSHHLQHHGIGGLATHLAVVADVEHDAGLVIRRDIQPAA